jgi:hypothetical protein
MTDINNRVLFGLLEELGVRKISIEYDGGGDSGSIESIQFIDKDGKPIADEVIPTDYMSSIDTAGYEILHSLYQTDWWNNEGGFGTLIIDLETKEYTIDGYYRITDTEEAPDSGTLEDLFTHLDKNGTSL